MGGHINIKGHKAQKINLKEANLQTFRESIYKLLEDLDNLYQQEYNSPIWSDKTVIQNGIVFNGSTSFVLDNTIDATEILKYKDEIGDVDVTIPEVKGIKFANILESITDIPQGKFTYIGSRRTNKDIVGDQILTLFKYTDGNYTANCQIDFELEPYQHNQPNEWCKFVHGSSYEDAKIGIKAACHKLLVRAIVPSLTEKDNIILASPYSTPESIVEVLPEYDTTCQYHFNQIKGLGLNFTPMKDNGKNVFKNGKQVFVQTFNYRYIRKIDAIFRLVFKGIDADIKDFWSFKGCVDILKKCPRKIQLASLNRFVYLMFGKGAKTIDYNLEIDKGIKLKAYNYACKELNWYPEYKKYFSDYYDSKENIF